MPRVEETHLSTSSVAWRKSALLIKPCQAMLGLIGKNYMAACQASAPVYTMAYQAGLIKEAQLQRWPEMAHAISYFIAALVAMERQADGDNRKGQNLSF